jgi:hypothetical protein
MIIFVKIIVYWWLLGYLKLLCPTVRNMDNNEKSPPEEKKLKLDLREAMPNGFDDDDDIIELKDEVTLPPKEKEAQDDLGEPPNLKFPDDEPVELKFPDDEPADGTVIGLDTPDIETAEAEPENVNHQADELTFEEEDEGGEDEKIQPQVVEKPLVMGDPDEVVEVTEFDDILSEDDNEMITLVEESEEIVPEEDEEEFLELIDVEDDSLPELNSFLDEEEEVEDKTIEIEDEIIQFDGFKEDIEDVELEDFINDSLGEEIRIDDDLEDDLTNSLGVEAGSELNMTDQGPEAEDLDFNIDSREISEKIDQLDTIFFDDTETQTDFEDEMVSDDEEIEEAMSISVDEDEDEDIRIRDDEPSEETMPEHALAAFDDDFDEMEDAITEDEDVRIRDDEPSEETMPEPEMSAFGDDFDEMEDSITEDEDIRIRDDEPSEETMPEPALTAFDDDFDEMENDITEDEDIRITDDEPSEEMMPEPGIAALDVDHDKIEESIERIIQEHYSEKIESMVVEVIEKAVNKEIDRLKNILLEDNSSDSS